MISILDRHIFLDLLKALLAVLLVLSLIIDGLSFIQYLERVINGEINADVVLKLLGLETLRSTPRLIPPAFFLAILYVIGGMYRDSEMVALHSCAVSSARVYRPVVALALPLAAVTAWLTMSVAPWASGEISMIRMDQKTAAVELMGISEGRFNESNLGDTVFYVKEMSGDDHLMKGLFVYYKQQGKSGVIAAKEGYHTRDDTTGGRYLVLTQGHRYEGQPGEANYSIASFDTYALRIGDSDEERVSTSRSSLPTALLMASDQIKLQAELQERISVALLVLVMVLLSIPLSRSLPRQGPHGRIILGFFVYFFYFNLEALSKGWMVDGLTSRWMGMWWLHLLAAALVMLYLLMDRPLFRRLRRQLRRSN
ncbi:MAG: LPS export ABC transporter permease LptF [Candidatus Polarisedimenticolaceae bacterium]|nr:LPS export ABC transporter permease LptF [Candidatus Polarisedimenticolaceae bacterium]